MAKVTPSFKKLKQMADKQEAIRRRTVEVHQGDFNTWVFDVLASAAVADSKATFALLDQRSFECHWSTVQALADHKKGARKVELFYFFPTGWLHRGISGFKVTARLDEWWGDSGWRALSDMRQDDAAKLMTDRIRDLGYRDVKPWPIFESESGGGRTMYHMIHATDHDEAPRLMYRAYKKLIATPQEQEQMGLWEREHLHVDEPASEDP